MPVSYKINRVGAFYLPVLVAVLSTGSMQIRDENLESPRLVNGVKALITNHPQADVGGRVVIRATRDVLGCAIPDPDDALDQYRRPVPQTVVGIGVASTTWVAGAWYAS
ncbi:MAG: hypothetical protein QF773_00085 [Lentisphaeria bacterium]|jgi:hypothetical protein|nr:hypothetical protein [Lentisphaeria bacterium]